MKLAFQIAKRFLLSAKKQTILIIIGNGVGISVQVFIGSLISGLQVSLVDSTIGSRSQITINIEDEYISDYQNTIATIEASSENITVVSPTVSTSGSLVKGESSEIIVLRGLEFSTAEEIYNLEDKLVEGSSLPTTANQVLLGKNLKDLLGVSIGDTVEYDAPFYNGNFEVVGFFDFKVQEINNTWGLTTIPTVQNILGITDQVSQIEMQLDKVFDADLTKDEIVASLNDSTYTVSTWIAENEELLSGLQGQSSSSLTIQVAVVISVVISISSVLSVTVLQKSRQLGILKAMGVKDKDASMIFLFEGLLLGVFGAIVGILLGMGLLLAFTTFALNPDGTPVIPLSFDIGFLLLSGGIAIVASTLATLSPARKSSRLSVIEVIRNG